MKKNYFLVLCVCLFLGQLSAQNPTLEWVALGDGIEMDAPVSIKSNVDGEVFVLANFHSSALASSEQVKHGLTSAYTLYNPADGSSAVQATSTGAPDQLSTSGNSNLIFYKMKKDGNLIWKVSSNIGDFSKGVVAPTADGGAMLALKMRHTSRSTYEAGVLLGLVDASGQQVNVEWQAPDYETYGGVYQLILVKLDKDGKVESTKLIPVDYKTETIDGTVKKFNDNFGIADMFSDVAGNIYLAGYYCTTINFGRQANLSTPHNVTGWDGDSQKTRGDMFLVKLDTDGKAIWNVTTKGTVQCERPAALDFDGENIYLAGYFKGNDDKSESIELGSTRLTPSGGDCLYYTCISTDGTVKWARMLESALNDEGARRIKPMCISVNKEKGVILMGGAFSGNILDGTSTLLANPYGNTMGLRAYLMQCDVETGIVNQAYGRIEGGLTEVESAYRIGDKIYAVAYELYNAEYLAQFDAELKDIEESTLFSCTQISSQGGLIMDDLLICAGRARSQSLGAVTFPGSDLQLKTNEGGWASVFTGHRIPGLTTGICSPESAENSFNVYAAQGSITIETASSCQVNIYHITGILSKSLKVEEGTTSVSMPQGMYVVNGYKVLVY